MLWVMCHNEDLHITYSGQIQVQIYLTKIYLRDIFVIIFFTHGCLTSYKLVFKPRLLPAVEPWSETQVPQSEYCMHSMTWNNFWWKIINWRKFGSGYSNGSEQSHKFISDVSRNLSNWVILFFNIFIPWMFKENRTDSFLRTKEEANATGEYNGTSSI